MKAVAGRASFSVANVAPLDIFLQYFGLFFITPASKFQYVTTTSFLANLFITCILSLRMQSEYFIIFSNFI